MSTRARRTPFHPLLVFGVLLGIASLSLVAVARDAELGTPVRPHIVITEPSYAYDFSNDQILVGTSEFVFLGQVVEQVSAKGIPTSDPEIEIPLTQFSVRVIEQIKGKLPTEGVVVSQSSGVDKSSGDLILVDGDPLLNPGEIVLFSVNLEPDFGWYQIAAGPYGAIRAKDARESDALVARFQEAEQKQFVPVVDPNFVPVVEPEVSDDATSLTEDQHSEGRDKKDKHSRNDKKAKQDKQQ